MTSIRSSKPRLYIDGQEILGVESVEMEAQYDDYDLNCIGSVARVATQSQYIIRATTSENYICAGSWLTKEDMMPTQKKPLDCSGHTQYGWDFGKPKYYIENNKYEGVNKKMAAMYDNKLDYINATYTAPSYQGAATVDSQSLKNQAAYLLDEAMKIDSRPEDDFKTGAVLVFDKDFGKDKTYRYTAIKVDKTNWWLSASGGTGGASNGWQTWESLLVFSESNGGTVDGIWLVDSWVEVKYS